MHHRTTVTATVLAIAAALLPLQGHAGCVAQSGPRTAALVELYTSEGCSSCPPADRQLSRLPQALDAGAMVVPLSLHVDYWDYIGWSDPFAQSVFVTRQRWLVHANQGTVVYTPHFFVGGTEFRSWEGSLRDEVRRMNATTAAAQVRIEANVNAGGMLSLSASAIAPPGTASDLYLAVNESGLVSKVMRGENSGVTLTHDHVVRTWIGPIPLVGGEARVSREVALPSSWNRARLEVVGFVEDGRSGKVLQAVSAQQCDRS
jgi:hypothetical protein